MKVSGLRSREIFSNGAPEIKGDCRIAPPKDAECESCCPKPCCPDQCPPKVRLKDYLRIKPFIPKTCMTLAYEHCDPVALVGWKTCVTGKLRRRGGCETLGTLSPTSATMDGQICFDWGIDLWKHGNGDYELELLINNKCCLTIGLRLIGCHIFMASYNHHHQETCLPTSCDDNGCKEDCAVPLDIPEDHGAQTNDTSESNCAEC